MLVRVFRPEKSRSDRINRHLALDAIFWHQQSASTLAFYSSRFLEVNKEIKMFVVTLLSETITIIGHTSTRCGHRARRCCGAARFEHDCTGTRAGNNDPKARGKYRNAWPHRIVAAIGRSTATAGSYSVRTCFIHLWNMYSRNLSGESFGVHQHRTQREHAKKNPIKEGTIIAAHVHSWCITESMNHCSNSGNLGEADGESGNSTFLSIWNNNSNNVAIIAESNPKYIGKASFGSLDHQSL